MTKRNKLAIIIILIAFSLDRIVKIWCVNVLKDIGSIPIIKDVLHFTYAENTGAAFSMLSGKRFLLIGISFVALALLFYIFNMKEFRDSKLMGIAIPLVVGGAMGNLIDRIAFGYVVDFVDVRAISFAVFNIADITINIGGFLLLIYIIFMMKDIKKEVKND